MDDCEHHNGFVFCAGFLLTGGRSRRMGVDKASLAVPPDRPPEPSGPSLAARTAALLQTVCDPVVEVGPGRTDLPVVAEEPPFGGPLSAIVAGWRAVTATGWRGPVLVVATDLPRLNVPMLEWLAGRPGGRSVVPVAAGRVQPLCARYSPEDLDVAVGLYDAGARAVRDLLDAVEAELVAEDLWQPVAGDPSVLEDVDTPEDLRRVTGL